MNQLGSFIFVLFLRIEGHANDAAASKCTASFVLAISASDVVDCLAQGSSDRCCLP